MTGAEGKEAGHRRHRERKRKDRGKVRWPGGQRPRGEVRPGSRGGPGEHAGTGGRPPWEGPEELEAGSQRQSGLPPQQPGGRGTRGLEKAAEAATGNPRTSGRSLGFCPKGGEAFEGRDH